MTFQGVVLNFNSLKDNISEVDSTSQIEGDWKQVEMSLSPSTYRVSFCIMCFKHNLVLFQTNILLFFVCIFKPPDVKKRFKIFN